MDEHAGGSKRGANRKPNKQNRKIHNSNHILKKRQPFKPEKGKNVFYISSKVNTNMSQPRDDYRELLLLSLVFLDSSSEETFSFKRPGAMHHARWMSKAIYSLKIFLFRSQFNLSAEEKKNLRRICIFMVLFYIRVWYNSTSAIQAPNNDLEFMKNLIYSKNTDPPVLQRACQKMIEHLWYLNEELVTLSLFDSNVSFDVKKKIVAAINTRESSSQMPKRYEITEQNLQSLLQKDLSDFVSKNSVELFKKFDLPCDFLEDNVSTWCSNDSYKECLEYFNTLKVTNDVAERGVALIQEYNNCLTKNEEQLQYLLQVVREHRLRYPNCNKTTLQQDQFNALLDKCSNLINTQEEKEIILYCLGAAIQRGIILALKICERHVAFQIHSNTFTVELTDDLVPTVDEEDYETQRRFNSALRIRVFRTIIEPAATTSVKSK